MEIVTAEEFLRYYEGIRQRTRRVAERIPPEHLEWRCAEGRFSCGDLVRHIAGTERFMFTENVQGNPSRYPGHDRRLAEGLDAVLAYFDRLHAESVGIIAGLSEADLRRHCTTPAGTRITSWKWLRAMVEHEVHHRGQIYLMLGMLGAPAPPLYGLTEPEVLARSIPAEAN